MFSSEFFPTPRHIIKKMLKPYLKTHKDRWGDKVNTLPPMTILEPSAGKGDIVDYIQEEFNRHRDHQIYCIEQQPELKSILQEKGYRVIATDFLEYTGGYYFDLIIMNPPFSNGDEHLLHAWKLLKEGNIVCLLNSETLNNPYTEKRKLLKKIIEDNHGQVEDLGPCFSDAERKTTVSVSLVRLNKVAEKGAFDFEFKKVTSEKEIHIDESTFQDVPAMRDVIGNMIIQFEELKKYQVEYMRIKEGLEFYSRGLLTDYKSIHDVLKSVEGDTKQMQFNCFNDLMKSQIWSVVLNKINMDKLMTKSVRDNFQKFSQAQGHLDFTRENAEELVNLLFLNQNTILEKCIVDVFDEFTKYHKENRLHVEGWKTNDRFKVNRKVILPYFVSYGSYMNKYDLSKYGDKFSVNFHYRDTYTDIDKAMCFITGVDYYSCCTIYDALQRKFEYLGKVGAGSFDGTCESRFFKMRFFKKGTLHIEFKDEWLWQEFNMRACADKNWLPEAEYKVWKESKNRKEPSVKMLELPLAS